MFIADASLDFHDFGVLDAYMIEKHLNEFIEDSQIAGHTCLMIITGKGEFVRPIVRALLQKDRRVQKFRHAGTNNGAFEVTLVEE